MSNRIVNISAIVSGLDTTFSRTMRNVRDELTRTANAAAQTANSLRAADVFGGIMPVFDVGSAAAAAIQLALRGARAAVQEFNESLKRIEERKDAADVLGMTYNEMQAIEVAATLANMPVDRLSGTFGRLLKTVALAGEGSKEAEKDLSRLGITLRDIEGLTSFQVLELVADRLVSISSPAERAAAAMELFGREAGLKMTQVLAGGSQSLQQYMKQAEELGLTLHPYLVDQAKLAQDSFDLTTLRLNGQMDSMSSRLSFLKRAAASMAGGMIEAAGSMFEFGAQLEATRRMSLMSSEERAMLDSMSLGSQDFAKMITGDMSPIEHALGARGESARPVVEGQNEARKLESVYAAIEEEQKKSAERIAISRRESLTQQEMLYWEEVKKEQDEAMEQYQKDLDRVREGELAQIRQQYKMAEDAGEKAAKAWDASGGGMSSAPLTVMGTAEQQLASYQASRARDNAAQRADFIRNAIREAMNGITVNTNVVQGGVTAAPV
jgi:hypothetical protein